MRLRDILAAQQRAFRAALDEGLARVRDEVAEEVVRRLASEQVGSEEANLRGEIDSLAAAVHRLAEEQRATAVHLEEAIERIQTNLDARAGAAIDDLGRRTGEGVVAVARVLRRDLEALHDSLRSLQRTVAWGEPRAPREADPSAGGSPSPG